MKKYCIFCGEKPVSKNMEHVIPQWLIEYTGDPNRKIRICLNYDTGKFREFAFKQLKFPACELCNSKFSKLETQTKPVIINLLNEQPLSSTSFSILLNWFDKVRVGLWLGFLALSKDRYGIVPNYYIEKRIATTDRMLLIYKTDSTLKGINFGGVDMPFFYMCPTCYSLRINQFYFINISTDFLFSRRLGLPYPEEKYLVKNQKIEFCLVKGKERIILPLIKAYYDKSCTELYQPIIRSEFMDTRIMSLYNNNYAKNYFDNLSLNCKKTSVGKILINYNNKIVSYPKPPTKQWIPNKIHKMDILIKLVAKIIIYAQNYLWDEQPSFDHLDLKDKQSLRNLKKCMKDVNKTILRKIEKEF